MVQTAIDKMKVDLLLIFINHSLKLFCVFVYLFIVSRPLAWKPKEGGQVPFLYFPLCLPLPCIVISIYLWNNKVIIQPHLLAQNYSFPKFTYYEY